MTQPGLNLVAPDLAELVASRDDAGQRRAAIAAASWATEKVGLMDDTAVVAALAALERGAIGQTSECQAVTQLAEQLDERAWNVQDEVEAGQAEQASYLTAFMRARAAAAVQLAFDENAQTAANEAIYEAHHATQDIEQLRATITAS